MGRQFRPPHRKGGTDSALHSITIPQVVTSSSTVIAIPNYGITDVSAYAAGDYVLDAPDAGVTKIIVSASSTSSARVIRCATDTSVKCVGQAGTQITFGASTVDMAIHLVGLNTTRWVVVSMHPEASTGAGVAVGTS